MMQSWLNEQAKKKKQFMMQKRMVRRSLNAKKRNNIRKCDGSKNATMSVRDFCISERGEKPQNRIYHINDRLICKYVWSTKKELGR